MSEINERCLETFPAWLEALGDDISNVLRALQSDQMDGAAQGFLTGGVNYLFKTLDLIPEGIDDIGYLDNAFVLRLTAKAAVDVEIGPIEPELIAKVGRLAAEAELIHDFLGEAIYQRLDHYARALGGGTARGRAVSSIIEDEAVRAEFFREVQDFTRGYRAPIFASDEKNLIKLTAFLEAKLPK